MATKKTTKSLAKIIDKLARKKGYPAIKLTHSEYTEVLKAAHKKKYGK